MEIVKVNVNSELKLKSPEELALINEVIELNEVRACLNYFLASYQSQLYTATAQEARVQMEFVKANLVKAKAALDEYRANNPTERPSIINLAHNEDEIKAIQLFNADKRFKITE